MRLYPNYYYWWNIEVIAAVAMENAVFWVWRRLALVRTVVSEERNAFMTKMERISEPGTLAVTND
jgi:hypothetical protein